jgi:hypothetical protein
MGTWSHRPNLTLSHSHTFHPHASQVSGDSGNDKELFLVPGVLGCVVSNAHPELRAFAESYREFREQANGDATRPRIFEVRRGCVRPAVKCGPASKVLHHQHTDF